MTFTITRAKMLAIVGVLALLIPAAAYASHDFDDVEDGHFYHDASSWAADNGITLGCVLDGSLFCGENPVTRGENITFAHRYDTNVVQPVFDDLYDEIDSNHDDITDNEDDIEAIEDSRSFAVMGAATQTSNGVDSTGESVSTVEVTAPVGGQVTVNSTVIVIDGTAGDGLRCMINDSDDEDVNFEQIWRSSGSSGDRATLSGSRVFDISAGSTQTYYLYCEKSHGTGTINVWDRVMTAIFTPGTP